jgi:nucleotide sugar dehydrogenase
MMANICVIGLGRIGLPLALLLTDANHKVIGVDNNQYILEKISTRKLDEKNAKIEKAILEKYFEIRFFVTNDLNEALSNSNVVFITIGTGIGEDGSPDLSVLYNLFNDICMDEKNIKGKLFILKSTLPVGTTRKITDLIEKQTEFVCGEDFYMVFSPERVLGNKAITEMKSLPKIIGGINHASAGKAAEIYETIGGKLIYVNNPEEAELIKLMDNSYRQTLFAFANDLSLIAQKYHINAYEIIEKANDNYPRNNIPFPSAGVSGYCLTKDPLYLESVFKDISAKRGFSSVWYYARKSNDYMPKFVVDLFKQELVNLNIKAHEVNVLVCGITYKENTDDIRFSHGLEIAAKLRDEKMNVFLWDPVVNPLDLDYTVVQNPYDIISDLDALIFTVKHNEFLMLKNNDEIINMALKMRTPIIVDGWGIFQNLIGSEKVHYCGVGIPG